MTVSSGNIPTRIFISYRHKETAAHAGWLFDRLVQSLGEDQVFKDFASIKPGDDFVEQITAAVESCVVLLALIGGRWLTIADQDGRPRLDDPRDFVRLEIEAALARNVRVIPILVDGARMPRAEDLPAGMAKLAYRQALELSANRFDDDSQRLLRVLNWAIAETQEQARREAEPAAEQPRQPPEDRSRAADDSHGESTRPTTPREQPYLPAGSPPEPAPSDAGEPARKGFLALERGEADEAAHWFLRAIDAGDSDGMLGLGIVVLDQEKNLEEATQWFLRAADAGNSDGMFCLGALAQDRDDTDEAGRWFRKAAKAGNADGMAVLGMLALDRGDADEAGRWFRKAAKAGNADGMAGLGALALDRGDADKAGRWFRKAAKAGNADAMAGLGALARDQGDTDAAERWFRQAAEAGNADAMAGLGALAQDRGDTDAAEQWIGKAVVASDIDAADRLTSPYIFDLRSAVMHPWESDMDDAPDAIPIDPGYFQDS